MAPVTATSTLVVANASFARAAGSNVAVPHRISTILVPLPTDVPLVFTIPANDA